MRRWFCFALISVLSCASSTPEAEQRSAPHDALPVQPTDPFLASCQEGCVRARQMQAISAQSIDAQCTELCKLEWAYPQLINGARTGALRGQRAKVVGVLALATDGSASIRLWDGSVFVLERVPDARALQSFAGKKVIVVGTVESLDAARAGAHRGAIAQLDHVTTLAPAAGSL